MQILSHFSATKFPQEWEMGAGGAGGAGGALNIYLSFSLQPSSFP
jgi:glycerate kinase